jgi:hypothetical protein
MTPLITPAQGRACLAAAKRIAEGKRADNECLPQSNALETIGWRNGYEGCYFSVTSICEYDPAHAMLALTWCAELGKRGDPIKDDAPRTKVRKIFPSAVSEECGDYIQIVVIGKYAKATIIGIGRSVKDAWAEAARRLDKQCATIAGEA